MAATIYCPDCEADVTPASAGASSVGGDPRCPIDGSKVFALQARFRPGTIINSRFTLQRPLGKGGTGVVFVAHEHAHDREVALKMMTTGGDETLHTKRFLREARAMMRVQHPRVVEVYDVGQTPEGDPYIVMEVLGGHELADVIASEAPFDAGRAAYIGARRRPYASRPARNEAGFASHKGRHYQDARAAMERGQTGSFVITEG